MRQARDEVCVRGHHIITVETQRWVMDAHTLFVHTYMHVNTNSQSIVYDIFSFSL